MCSLVLENVGHRLEAYSQNHAEVTHELPERTQELVESGRVRP